jgi:hypothetical protein
VIRFKDAVLRLGLGVGVGLGAGIFWCMVENVCDREKYSEKYVM